MKKYLTIALVALAVAALVMGVAGAKSKRSTRGAYLGVVTQSVDYDLAETFDLDVNYGVIVNEVVDDSPAETAGIEVDDIIISIGGERITDYDDLIDLLDEHKPGDVVAVKLVRDGEELDIEVELTERDRRRRDRGWHDRNWSYHYSYDADWPFGDFHFDGRHSYIGVRLSDLSKQLGTYFGVDKGRGALINEVEEDSPAEEAGLQAGDVIVSIDSDRVRDAADVSEYILDTEPGEKVNITVVRDKSEVTFEVEVDESSGASRHGFVLPSPPSPRSLQSLEALRGLDALEGLEALEALEGLEGLRALDNLGRLNIKIPTVRAPQVTALHELDGLERSELKRDMKELRRELMEMQKELRKELEELRLKVDN